MPVDCTGSPSRALGAHGPAGIALALLVLSAAFYGAAADSAAFQYQVDKNIVTFVADDPEGLTYQWSFGDGSFGDGRVVSHPYDTVGRYTVVLKVTTSSPMGELYYESRAIVEVDEVYSTISFGDGSLLLYSGGQVLAVPLYLVLGVGCLVLTVGYARKSPLALVVGLAIVIVGAVGLAR